MPVLNTSKTGLPAIFSAAKRKQLHLYEPFRLTGTVKESQAVTKLMKVIGILILFL
jgi:hypothetical protein